MFEGVEKLALLTSCLMDDVKSERRARFAVCHPTRESVRCHDTRMSFALAGNYSLDEAFYTRVASLENVFLKMQALFLARNSNDSSIRHTVNLQSAC